MAHVTWDHTPPATWIVMVDGQALCSIKRKDIGGLIAAWVDERLWPAPAHLPKAMPQPTRFFSNLEEAKLAVEHALSE